ncbi:CHASE3 domain-containing protein [Mycobacterium sp. smrl_JER01]|uniref:CHASE3 domain-containing protein n=1 Tax=Mycobacterium sp. smrl_JER01 TaxID=3402633 RepID=UPI003AC353BB
MSENSGPRRLSLKQLIWACLGVIAAVFLAVSTVAVIGQIRVARAVDELSTQLDSVQRDVEVLRRAYVDQETGQRGYLLTGSAVTLEPYAAGVATAEETLTRLRADLADDPEAGVLLDRITAAAAAWTTEAAEPHIAVRREGPVSPQTEAGMALEGKRLFDRLRTELRALGAYTAALSEAQVVHIQAVQRTATTVQAVGAVILLLTVVGAVIVIRRLLTQPVRVLVQRVKEVAAGDDDRPLPRPGLRETTEIADAVEQMRLSLRASTDLLVDSELREEQARIAADLHDRVIQRVFGLGLGLTSASSRRNPDLEPFIDETDAIIRDLREVIFNLHQTIAPTGRSTRLRSAVIDVVEGSAPALGFSPTLQFDGPVDAAPLCPELYAAVLAVVREALSNVARHAGATAVAVNVEVSTDRLRIIVRDNGIGVSDQDVLGHGRRNIAARAAQFGGTATVCNNADGPGAVVEWIVPLQQNTVVDAAQSRSR